MSGSRNSSDQSHSPSTSQRHDSFSTSAAPIKRKNSSPLAHPIDPAFVDDDITELAQSSFSPPQALRKSVSVDSFSHYNQEYWPNRGQLAGRPGGLSAASASQAQVVNGRLRGESLSSMRSVSGRIFDADGDRYDPLSAAATERYRRSLKSHEAAKPLIRGGDLPLPSRSPNSMTSATPTPANMPRNLSLKQGSDRPGSSGGRSRSRSIGYNAQSSSRKLMINTHVPPSFPRDKDIILLVLGTHGCGKSTLIRKGLSGANLSETSVIWENPAYISRTAYVGVDVDSQGSHLHALQVIEGDISSTTTDLPYWPSELPPIDGVILCYDSSSQESFRPIKGLLKGYREMGLPVVALHCKVDLTKEDGSGVDPQEALVEVKKYDTGLIQVSSGDPSKMVQSINYILMAIVRQRGSNPVEENRNPASPTIIRKGNSSRSPLVPHQVLSPANVLENAAADTSPLSDTLPLDSDASSTIQPRTNQLVLEVHGLGTEAVRIPEECASLPNSHTLSIEPVFEVPNTQVDDISDGDESPSEEESAERDTVPVCTTNDTVRKEVKHGQWTHLDELLDRLLFIAISEEDPNFIANFLLTYRRFTTPRTVLLAMQKRLRQLDDPSGDPMFACFAQMRICHLLETWTRDYPNDFAVKGTVGALSALNASIKSKTHLLHYASEFQPFEEQIPSLKEQDTAWGLKTDIVDTDSESFYESEDDETRVEAENPATSDAASVRPLSSSSKDTIPSRERKSSFPLAKTLFSPSQTEPTTKQLLKDLVKLANEVLTYDSDDIANEITRRNVELFLKIQPRDWVHFTFISPTRKAEVESISEYNSMSNYLADWVSCLILCHDQPRQRARQVEKFVEIALKIRLLNNYSGLRAFVAGINLAADDVTLEAFKMKSPEPAKNLRSWDVLLKQLRSHRAYRLALRNSKAGCIPALEVHMQDLIKANEGNPDHREDDPTLIHWGKYNMIARFIGTVVQCQNQCRSSPSYTWPGRPDIAGLLRVRPLMSVEMQHARLTIPENGAENNPSTGGHSTGLRKLIFW